MLYCYDVLSELDYDVQSGRDYSFDYVAYKKTVNDEHTHSELGVIIHKPENKFLLVDLLKKIRIATNYKKVTFKKQI